MKKTLSLWVLYQVITILWYIKIYKYYFEYGMADGIGLILFASVCTFFLFLPIKKHTPIRWFSILLLLAIPFSAFPLISFGMKSFNESWVLFYGFIFISAFAFAITRSVKILSVVLVSSLAVWVLPIKMYLQQTTYSEKLVEVVSTRKAEIHLTTWKGNHWLYYDKQLQYATADKHIYVEAFAIPALSLLKEGKILLLGGDNGLIASEVSKLANQNLEIVPYDLEYHDYNNRKNKSNGIVNRQSIFNFLGENKEKYDLIFVDIPDPKNLDYAQYYSKEFYELCLANLSDKGMLVTQLGDAYYSRNICLTGLATLEAAGFDPLFYHVQVPSLGQWGWAICQKDNPSPNLREQLLKITIPSTTEWLTADALKSMFMSGKWDYFESNGYVVNSVGSLDILTLENN